MGDRGLAVALAVLLGAAAQDAATGDPKTVSEGVFQWEAEDYTGGAGAVEGRDYHDLTPGNGGRAHRQHDVDISVLGQVVAVTDIQPGEWLAFRFQGEGRYEVEVRYAGPGGTAHLEVNGLNVTGPITLPPLQAPGQWANGSATAQPLGPGTHELRLVFDTRIAAVDSFVLRRVVPAPVPAAGALKDSLKTIRDLLKSDYAKKAPADVQALARKLLQEGLRTEGDATGRYAFLTEARDLAVQAGDVPTALSAIDDLEKRYAVDGPALRTSALTALGRKSSPEAARGVAEAWLAFADQAAARDDFDPALAHLNKAETSAKSAQDPALVGRIQAREKEVASLRDEVRALKGSLKTLEEKPDDAAANLAVGLHFCFTRGDWARGLPHLAKGSDAAVAAVAKRELAGEAKLAVAEAWRETGEKKTGTLKARCLTRALTWYERGLADATGIERAKAEVQIEALYKATGSDAVRKGLVFWVEPGRDPSDPFRELVSGAKGTNNGASTVADGALRVMSFSRSNVEYAASESVKAIDKHGSIFAWVKVELAANQGYVTMWSRGDRPSGGGAGQDDLNLWVGARGDLATWFNRPENQAAQYSRATVKNQTWTHCGAVWDDANVIFYLDGKEENKVALAALAVPVRRTGKVALGTNIGMNGPAYTGLLGSIHVYNRSLSAAEVNQLYMTSRNRFR